MKCCQMISNPTKSESFQSGRMTGLYKLQKFIQTLTILQLASSKFKFRYHKPRTSAVEGINIRPFGRWSFSCCDIMHTKLAFQDLQDRK